MRPRTSGFLLLPILLLSCPTAFAQAHAGAPTSAEIQIRVIDANDRSIGERVQVDLLNDQHIPVAQTFTNSEGQVTFHVNSTGGGIYFGRASGRDIEPGTSDAITLSPGDRVAMAWIHVQQKPGAATPTETGGAAVTAANELKIPAAARKSFMKGTEALSHQDYRKAAEAFEKAVAAYPQYDAAYDDLGVTYMRLAQTDKARAAFERAVQLNDKNADADRNFARLLINDKENVRAIEVLNKALMVQPQDAAALTLIAIAQLRTGDVDAALQNALKVHQFPHENYAIAHYIAARVYEARQQYQQAAREYETYLKESPQGPQAAQVRSALARLAAGAAPPSAATQQ